MTTTEILSMIMSDLLSFLRSSPTQSPVFNSQQELAPPLPHYNQTLSKRALVKKLQDQRLNQDISQPPLSYPTPISGYHNHNQPIFSQLAPLYTNNAWICRSNLLCMKEKSHPLIPSIIFIMSSSGSETEKNLHMM